MRIEKNKIVFTLLLVSVLLFIGAYYALTFGGDEDNNVDKNQIPVPELKEGEKQYGSKLEALDDIKEEQEKTAPSLYPEHMVDEKGYFNPDYMEFEKQRIIDSIYREGDLGHEVKEFQKLEVGASSSDDIPETDKDIVEELWAKERDISANELELEHQLFFASDPSESSNFTNRNTDARIFVRVDGTQTVKKDFRLQMRLTKEATVNGMNFPRNTAIYGFISFKPNRTMVEIDNINHRPVKLMGYDLQDGSEGIYIENGFRAQASQEVVGDMVEEINITGVPQVTGIKKIFQRNHHSTRVTIMNNYQLILKPKQ